MTIHYLPGPAANDAAAAEYAGRLATGVQEAQVAAFQARPRRSRWLLPISALVTLYTVDAFFGPSHAIAFACGSIISVLFMIFKEARSVELDQEATEHFLHDALADRAHG